MVLNIGYEKETLLVSGHHNKREKLSTLLFDLVKFLLTVIGVGAIIPDSKISIGTALVGIIISLVVLMFALIITPEDKE